MVAACVMTFEARDSAAKVVPTRVKYASAAQAAQRHGGAGGTKLSPASASGRLHSSVRTDSRRSTAKWDPVYRVVGGSPLVGDRRALTQAFIQFSRELQRNTPGGMVAAIAKSPSAPNLANIKSPPPAATFQQSYVSLQPRGRRRSRSPSSSGRPSLLSPHALLQRQAVSMDNPDTYFSPSGSQQLASAEGGGSAESVDADPAGALGRPLDGSQTSMNIDLHLPNDCPVTLRIKDRTRRSETAKRHALVRQTQIADDEEGLGRRETHSCSPRLPGHSQRQTTYDDRPWPYSASTPHSRRDSLSRAAAMSSRTVKGEIRRCNSSDSRRVGDVCRSGSYEKQAQLEGRLLFQSIRKSDDELIRKSEYNESGIAENN